MQPSERQGPELSDLIVDYDPQTLLRLPVRKQFVLDTLTKYGRRWPLRIARSLPEDAGVLEPEAMDAILLRSHLELQRLHEEFDVGRTVLTLLGPLLDLARRRTHERPLRIVDVGCGLGYITRWLATVDKLGDDVELVGVDYNRALLGAARSLAEAEQLDCRFIAANAFSLKEPAHLYMSTGVVHHFRGDDLARFFAEHERAGAFGYLHVDIRPSLIAPLGSFVFHQARMREPLARFDGYFSAVRAHHADTLLAAARDGLPDLACGMLDARIGLAMLVRIFQAVVGARVTSSELASAYVPLGRRFEEPT